MRVKCINNKTNILPTDMTWNQSICKSNTEFIISIGAEYNVYALTISEGFSWYFIEDEQNSFPGMYPAPLFCGTENKLSRYWVFSNIKGINYKSSKPVFSFPEWAEDPDFYEKLIENFDREVSLFNKYKTLMDLEFPDNTISTKAEIIDESWLLCPLCLDAWESKSGTGMVICPLCNTLMQNPRYKAVPSSLKQWILNES